MPPISTTTGPIERPGQPVGHVINTTANTYEDEEEILAVVPATGWYAQMDDGTTMPLLVFVVTDDGDMFGTVLTDEGGIDLTSDVSKRDDFVRYTNIKESK